MRTPLELLLKMRRELTGKAATEVRCTVRVVHIQPEFFLSGKSGIGVQIDMKR